MSIQEKLDLIKSAYIEMINNYTKEHHNQIDITGAEKMIKTMNRYTGSVKLVLIK